MSSDLQQIIELTEEINRNSDLLVNKIVELSYHSANAGGVSPFIFGLTIFILACFVGYSKFKQSF